jgi:hypothetical protein
MTTNENPGALAGATGVNKVGQLSTPVVERHTACVHATQRSRVFAGVDIGLEGAIALLTTEGALRTSSRKLTPATPSSSSSARTAWRRTCRRLQLREEPGHDRRRSRHTPHPPNADYARRVEAHDRHPAGQRGGQRPCEGGGDPPLALQGRALRPQAGRRQGRKRADRGGRHAAGEAPMTLLSRRN